MVEHNGEIGIVVNGVGETLISLTSYGNLKSNLQSQVGSAIIG